MFVVYTKDHNTFFLKSADDVLHVMSGSWSVAESLDAHQVLSRMHVGDKFHFKNSTVSRVQDYEARQLAGFFGISEEFQKEYGMTMETA